MDIGFLFDMDGVIVDNHTYHFKAWQAFAKKYELGITEKFYKENMNGRTMKSCLELVFGREMDQNEVHKFDEEKETLYREIYKPELKPHTGLIELLNEAKSKNVSLAVATSAPPVNVDFTLDGLGIRHYFTSIVDATQVSRGKPNPEVYLKSSANLGLTPSKCVVFEDALRGMESGRNAGCKVVGVATTHKPEEIIGTDLVINSFKDVTVDGLIKLAES